MGADVVGQDFRAPSFTISGRMTLASNPAVGVASERIDLSGSGSIASVRTDTDGQYSFLVPNGDYTISPVNDSGGPLGTSPNSRSVTVNSANIANLDFSR